MPLINRVGGGSGGDLQPQTKTPTTSSKTYYPDSGYDGFSSFTVGAIPSSYKYVTTTQGTKEWTPTTDDQYIASGTYCSGKQTIKGDSDLVSGNIKAGVNIFGVTGTYTGGKTYTGSMTGSMYPFGDAENYIEVAVDPPYIGVTPTSVTLIRDDREPGWLIYALYSNGLTYCAVSDKNDTYEMAIEYILPSSMTFHWEDSKLYIAVGSYIRNGSSYNYSVSFN